MKDLRGTKALAGVGVRGDGTGGPALPTAHEAPPIAHHLSRPPAALWPHTCV